MNVLDIAMCTLLILVVATAPLLLGLCARNVLRQMRRTLNRIGLSRSMARYRCN